MSDWKRSTKETSIETLPPDLAAAIREHLERYRLGDILSDARMGVITESEKAKKGFFSRPEAVLGAAFVTPRWLVWVVRANGGKPAVTSAQLRDLVVQDYGETSLVKLVPDAGLQITGRFTDVSEGGSAFVGLDGSDPARRFLSLVITAAMDAKQ